MQSGPRTHITHSLCVKTPAWQENECKTHRNSEQFQLKCWPRACSCHGLGCLNAIARCFTLTPFGRPRRQKGQQSPCKSWNGQWFKSSKYLFHMDTWTWMRTSTANGCHRTHSKTCTKTFEARWQRTPLGVTRAKCPASGGRCANETNEPGPIALCLILLVEFMCLVAISVNKQRRSRPQDIF